MGTVRWLAGPGTIVLLCLAYAAVCRAETGETRVRDSDWVTDSATAMSRPALGVDVHLGLGAPTGYVGVMIDWSPSRYFALDAGPGWGARGVQLAVNGRFRLPLRSGLALGLGGGVSGGPFAYNEDSPVCILCDHGPELRYDFAWFANGNLSAEVRMPSGFQVRGYIGLSWLLNRDTASCDAKYFDLCPLAPARVPYVGVSLGRVWFL